MLGSSATSITLFSKLTVHYPSRENKAAFLQRGSQLGVFARRRNTTAIFNMNIHKAKYVSSPPAGDKMHLYGFVIRMQG